MALWILGILLVLLAVALLLRVGVHIRFGEELHVTAAVGPVRIQLAPPKERKKPEKPKEEKPPKPKKEKPEGKRLSQDLTAGDIREALPVLWEALKRGLGRTRQRLRIDPMQLSVCFGGDDPAQVAELYGLANSAMWLVMPEAERLMRMPDPRIHLEMDFSGAETRLSGQVGLSLQIRDLLAIGLAFAGPALRWYRSFQETRRIRQAAAAKSGGGRKPAPQSEEKNDTSGGTDATTTN